MPFNFLVDRGEKDSDSVVASIPFYLFSFIKFPKRVLKAMNSPMSDFLWNDG
jgi:hypothetical protein